MLTPSFSVLLSCVSVTYGTWSMSLCFKSCAECLVPLHPLTACLRVFRVRLALHFPQGPWRPVRPSTGMALCSEHVLSALPGGEAGSDGPHEPSPPLLNFPWCHRMALESQKCAPCRRSHRPPSGPLWPLTPEHRLIERIPPKSARCFWWGTAPLCQLP